MIKATHTILLSALYACMFVLGVQSGYAQEVEADSITTPFRKGRWLTGLGGSISSVSTRPDTATSTTFSNLYSMELSTGIFVKDRWLAGIAFRANKSGSDQFVKRETESIFIGPFTSYYFIKSTIGSVFAGISPGYVRFRDLTEIEQNGVITKKLLDGQGVGLIWELGYSFVIDDRIAFDLGLGLTSSWINATLTSEPGSSVSEEKLQSTNMSFSFGFNVLLK